MGGGGGGGGSRAGLPKYIKPYVKDILSRAEQASNQVSNQPYTGGFFAPAQQGEFDAAQQTQDYGRQLGTNTGQSLVDLGQSQARGDFLTPGSNPYLQQNLDILRQNALRSYGETRKGITSQSIAQGAYGGDRGQLAQGQFAADTAQGINDQQANVLLQNYMAERANQQNSGGLIQQGIGLNMLGPEALAQGAQQQRSLEQIALDESQANFNERNAAPFRPLEPYANLIYGSAGTALNSRVPGGGGSGLGDILGGVLGATSIGSSLLGF